MNSKKIKKYIIVANLAVVLLAFPMYMGSSWLQANVIGKLFKTDTNVFLAPMNKVVSDTDLSFKIYDNFEKGADKEQFQKLIIDKINGAQKEIVIAMYSFDIEEIKEALLKAADRGVKVTLIYAEDNRITFEPFWNKASEKIQPIYVGANINSTNYSMHHKFMIIDAETSNRSVLTGTWNWTYLQENLDPSTILVSNNAEIVKCYDQEAVRLLNGNNGNQKFRLSDYRPWETQIDFRNNEKVEIWFSPGREKFSIQNRIVTMIDSAQETIDVANTIIDSSDIAQSLLKKAREGVKVRIVFDQLNVRESQSIFGFLSKHKEMQNLENLDLILGGQNQANEKGEYSIFHNHYLIIDKKQVLVGSANWSYGGQFLNDENFLVIHSDKYALRFVNIFESYLEYLKTITK